MEYKYYNNIKDNDILRESFNDLTRKVFGFDFSNWYVKGHWGEKYIPHVLVDDNNKVISNVSVNIMKFEDKGQIKNYIQLGTIMTHPEYRGQGLNKYLINKILRKYDSKVDGIYLFGNDSVLDYYPKFGFREAKEYEYSLKVKKENSVIDTMDKYILEKVDLSDNTLSESLYETIEIYDKKNLKHNPNDSFCMCNNLGLYQFWLSGEYGENTYYIPETKSYVIASVEHEVLTIHQIISDVTFDIRNLAASFQDDISEIKFDFTPIEKDRYEVNIHKVEDCTLFVLGSDLYNLEKKKVMFPALSHA